jgi:hypothetical protein
MTELLKVAEQIEKEVSMPMGDGGIDLSTLKNLREAIRAEKGKKDATKALAVKRSSAILRDVIQVDAHVREGEFLAALGAAAPVERTLTDLINFLTVLRDLETEKAEATSAPTRTRPVDRSELLRRISTTIGEALIANEITDTAVPTFAGLQDEIAAAIAQPEPDCHYCRNSRIDPGTMKPCPECRPQQSWER